MTNKQTNTHTHTHTNKKIYSGLTRRGLDALGADADEALQAETEQQAAQQNRVVLHVALALCGVQRFFSDGWNK